MLGAMVGPGERLVAQVARVGPRLRVGAGVTGELVRTREALGAEAEGALEGTEALVQEDVGPQVGRLLVRLRAALVAAAVKLFRAGRERLGAEAHRTGAPGLLALSAPPESPRLWARPNRGPVSLVRHDLVLDPGRKGRPRGSREILPLRRRAPRGDVSRGAVGTAGLPKNRVFPEFLVGTERPLGKRLAPAEVKFAHQDASGNVRGVDGRLEDVAVRPRVWGGQVVF